MDGKRLKTFLTDRGHFDLLRELEVYCSYPASPDVQDPFSDPNMEVKLNTIKEPTKRPAAVRPSEDFNSDSDPGTRGRQNTDKNKSGEAGVATPLIPASRGSNPPPVYGLKLQAKTVADFIILQILLLTQGYAFHTYSLKEEREIRVVLRGVSREIEELKEDLHSQNLPVPPGTKPPGFDLRHNRGQR
ncbi:hypothetical protein EVAR_44989_1 [Eumeta japonica]|uniref:Uncharacterized protein n=1 Tax=Eumeta variegata TaxID=151549 RepID=A0A4C1XFH5_EUMVA|nr:hypothetical protein EVAR_44989_1 [Eumeta japonica]